MKSVELSDNEVKHYTKGKKWPVMTEDLQPYPYRPEYNDGVALVKHLYQIDDMMFWWLERVVVEKP